MAAGVEELVEIIKIGGGPTAVVCLGWWLRGKFVEVQQAGEVRMASHEKQDERRHRQNLVRFAKLNMKLGIEDGNEANGDHEE